MNPKIAVLGGGSFGTAMAHMMASHGRDVTLWMRDSATAEQIRSTGENPRYFPGLKLSPELKVTSDLAAAVAGAGLILFAIPSKAFRDTAIAVKPHLASETVVVSLAKGIEAETFERPSQILEEVLPGHPIGVLSGPNLAKEIAKGEITATVIASEHPEVCQLLQSVLASRAFRVYSNPDRFGVELAGALKNIYAIIAGIADARGMGQNTKSVIITRSLAEMSRFAQRLGANPMTFLGLSGVGDLYVTCTSPLSRNFQVGLGIGSGKSLQEVVNAVGQVAEGVNTTRLVKEKADELGVYMPLASALYQTLFTGTSIEVSLMRMMQSEQNTDVEFMENS